MGRVDWQGKSQLRRQTAADRGVRKQANGNNGDYRGLLIEVAVDRGDASGEKESWEEDSLLNSPSTVYRSPSNILSALLYQVKYFRLQTPLEYAFVSIFLSTNTLLSHALSLPLICSRSEDSLEDTNYPPILVSV